MADFENYALQATRICSEIERNMIALGINWRDSTDIQALAQDLLNMNESRKKESSPQRQIWRHELYGLIELMNRTMEESALVGIETHGNDMWKTLAKAMWEAKNGSSSEVPEQGAAI